MGGDDQDRSQLGRGGNGCQPSQPRYVNVMHVLYKMFITTYGCILHAFGGGAGINWVLHRRQFFFSISRHVYQFCFVCVCVCW